MKDEPNSGYEHAFAGLSCARMRLPDIYNTIKLKRLEILRNTEKYLS